MRQFFPKAIKTVINLYTGRGPDGRKLTIQHEVFSLRNLSRFGNNSSIPSVESGGGSTNGKSCRSALACKHARCIHASDPQHCIKTAIFQGLNQVALLLPKYIYLPAFPCTKHPFKT